MADKLLSHLSHVAEFMKTQRAIVDDATYESMLQAHFQSCKSSLQSSGKLGPLEASQISTAFSQGPWPDNFKKEFAVMVSEMVTAASSGSPAKRPSQECPHFRAYLSRADREVLRDAARSENEKLDQVACRCLKIGLILPTETTNGAIVLAAIASGLDSASPQHFYDILNSWKRKLKGKREKFAKNTPVQLTEYPESVDLLPENLKVSYNEDPPEPLTLEQCLHVNNMEALRKSSGKLGGRNLALQASGVASSGSGGLKNPDPVMMMGSMLTQCLQMMQASMGGGSNSASSSQASNLPGLHIFTPKQGNQGKQAQEQLQQLLPSAAPPSGSQLALPAPAAGTPAAGTEATAKPPAAGPPPPNPPGLQEENTQDPQGAGQDVYDMDEQLEWMAGANKTNQSLKKRPSMKKPHAAPSSVQPKEKAKAAAKVKSQPKPAAKSKCNTVVKKITKKSGWVIEFRRRATDQSLYGKWISPHGDFFKSSRLAEAAGFDPSAP